MKATTHIPGLVCGGTCIIGAHDTGRDCVQSTLDREVCGVSGDVDVDNSGMLLGKTAAMDGFFLGTSPVYIYIYNIYNKL